MMPSVSLIVLRTPELERVREWYESLGLRFVKEQHGQGPVHYSATLGRTVFEIHPGYGDIEKGSVGDIRLGFEVDDLDACLREIGGEPSVLHREGVRIGVAMDPDGRMVELSERT